MSKTVLFQKIQFCISTQFSCQNSSISSYSVNISTRFSSIWPIGWTLSGATTEGQSGPGSNGNEEVLHIPQSSSISGTSPSNYLVSYLGHSLGESYLSAKIQSVYSPAPADRASPSSVKTIDTYISNKWKLDFDLEIWRIKLLIYILGTKLFSLKVVIEKKLFKKNIFKNSLDQIKEYHFL